MNSDHEALKLKIKNAWLTLAMLPDPDARYRRALASGWVMKIVQDYHDAYGSTPASWKGTPSPKEISEMEYILDWLAWLRRVGEPGGGEYSIKRLAAWGYGVAVWKMAQREHCTEKTIYNRIDRSVAKILLKFRCIDVKFEIINEPEPRSARIRGFMDGDVSTIGGAPASLEPGRVYLDGIGFMFRGEKYRSAYDEAVDNRGKRRA
jgi:hypothetical protein